MEDFQKETVNVNAVTEVRPRILLGVIGALIGALLGAAIWIGIYQFGFIASLAGFATSYFAIFGFELLSKSKTRMGIVISLIISVVILLAAIYFCWGLDIYNVFKEDYYITFMDAMASVPSFVFSSELMGEYLKELLMALVFFGLGSFQFFKRAVGRRAANNPQDGSVN